jgi:4-hydroxy-L-threonine phosphate dehydrogenase PdxA
VGAAQFSFGTIVVYEVPLFCDDVNQIPYGKVTVTGGKAAFESVRTVIEWQWKIRYMPHLPGPLNKEALNLQASLQRQLIKLTLPDEDYAMMFGR